MGKPFGKRIPLEEALRIISELELVRVGKERVSVFEACDRILAEDIVAKWDVPPFDRAAMDGYAVRAEDTFGASQTNPIPLKLVEGKKIGEGEAVRISTGTAMPEGANAVVMLEFAEEREGYVDVFKAVTPWENVSKRGEDVRAGEVILRRGEILHPQDVGVIASLGYGHVEVLRRPRIGVVATGNELVEVGEDPGDGRIVNSNSPMLCCALRELGCDPVYLGIVEDDSGRIEEALRKALEECDGVIFTGGTSVGDRDLVPEVVGRVGRVAFHGVAIKPGMPVGMGVVDGKPVLMLPGFPVACLIAFNEIFPHVLSKLTGVRILARRGSVVRGRLSRRVPSQPGVRSFVRVIVRDGVVEPIRSSGSGILSSMVRANGMLVVPEEKEGYEEGEEVEVTLVRDIVKVF